MPNEKHVLMIGTNDIDCFFGLAKEFDLNSIRVVQVHSNAMAREYLAERAFAAIIINLEPDGANGIHGFEILKDIVKNKKQQDSVCFSVSVESASSLLSTTVEDMRYLSIIAGWLTLPINHKQAVKIILDVIESPGTLMLKHRAPL